jgi:Ankyrin repeats (3 copies)
VTFNHPDVVQALATQGADVSITESTGVNLLHWATITNRPTVIRILVKAGVPLNDVDGFGYTTLMYAATFQLDKDWDDDFLASAHIWGVRILTKPGASPITAGRWDFGSVLTENVDCDCFGIDE